ncbi:hypothetical protein THRCLA_07458, partial [Thraustotheca clavata]
WRCTLFSASKNGHNNIVNLLLGAGANVHQVNNILISASANVHQANKDGDTPLHCAFMNGRDNIVSILLARPKFNSEMAIIFAQKGDTALHVSARANIASILISAGANIHQTNDDGDTPLHGASGTGQKDVVSQLLSGGVDLFETNRVHFRNSFVLTIKMETHHSILRSKRKDMVKFLTSKRSNVNTASDNGDTPIVVAIKNADQSIEQILLNTGANVNQVDEYGKSILFVAAENCHHCIVSMLLFLGYGRTPIYIAAQKNHKNVVSLLISANADKMKANKEREADLDAAIRYGHNDVKAVLVSNPVNMIYKDKNGDTPLYVAAKHGYNDIVLMLLSREANVNQTNDFGKTRLFIASWNGHNEVVLTLIRAGADSNQSKWI